ncbi:hypothetical protein MMC31_001995 [Peltigera leucophlebia]|nr:hypothetical protein [Peltigera leucophlebia]
MLIDARLKLVLEKPTESLENLAIQGTVGHTKSGSCKTNLSVGSHWYSTGKGSENETWPPTNQAEKKSTKIENTEDPAASTSQKQLPFNLSEPESLNCAIIQISLSGPDLKAAWLSNETTRRLEAPGPNWAPSQPSAPYFYHGAAIRADPTKAQSIFTNGQDIGFSQPNQMCPTGAIYTSIFAARSFLWAVYLSSIFALELTPQQAGKLSRIWSVDGKC